ncbi:MAG: hypothetical protein HY888_01805, partial [Deltaproteobacteria bacterium]|nr:hypothetical protein [Deltaproteobacteria bacterium]
MKKMIAEGYQDAGTLKNRIKAVEAWLKKPTLLKADKGAEYAAVIEIAGCSLCMGNQARVPDGVNMFSTSTRNFDDRIGNGAKVYLGSAELGAVTALLGRLPKPAEFLKIYKEKIEPNKDKIYKYLQFDEMPEYK